MEIINLSSKQSKFNEETTLHNNEMINATSSGVDAILKTEKTEKLEKPPWYVFVMDLAIIYEFREAHSHSSEKGFFPGTFPSCSFDSSTFF